MNPIYPIFAVAGAMVDSLGGMITRPTFMGIPVSMDILYSSSPLDAPFKEDMGIYLLATTGAGLAAGIVIAFISSMCFGVEYWTPIRAINNYPFSGRHLSPEWRQYSGS